MLRQLDMPTLATRRTCNRIIMMFKIFKNVVHIPVEPPIFTFNTLETRGHSYKLNQLHTRINSYAASFFPDAIKLWNNLPTLIVNTDNLELLNIKFFMIIYVSNYNQCFLYCKGSALQLIIIIIIIIIIFGASTKYFNKTNLG